MVARLLAVFGARRLCVCGVWLAVQSARDNATANCHSSYRTVRQLEQGGGARGGGRGAEGRWFYEKALSLASFRIPAVCLLCLRLCALPHQLKSHVNLGNGHYSKSDRLLLQKNTLFLSG